MPTQRSILRSTLRKKTPYQGPSCSSLLNAEAFEHKWHKAFWQSWVMPTSWMAWLGAMSRKPLTSCRNEAWLHSPLGKIWTLRDLRAPVLKPVKSTDTWICFDSYHLIMTPMLGFFRRREFGIVICRYYVLVWCIFVSRIVLQSRR